MEQREVDNMLLSMIQKHFPSLPLSDEHTDWWKWLGFARAVYEAGRASPASVPEDYAIVPVEILDRFPEINPSNYDHDGACALNAWGVELVLSAAPTPQVTEDHWLPIETAPKDGTRIIVGYARQSGFPVKVVFYNKLHNYWSHYGDIELGLEGNATHWMPLPKAPATQEDKP